MENKQKGRTEMKRFLAVALTMAITLGLIPAAARDKEITVTVNGSKVRFPDEQPFEQSGRVMVPVRFVSEELGAEVNWHEQTQTVSVIDSSHAAALTIGAKEVTADNAAVTMDVSPVYRNDRTYVPLRFVSEALGAEVEWDENSRTVTVTRSPQRPDTGNDKKVYALYHGFRRTREHDGDLGTWQQYYTSKQSGTGVDHINFSADMIDGDGIHNLANMNGGPVVGMQSELDPAYIEYKMLLAKIAHIDGFMVDFGFPEYGNTVLIKAFMEQAEKYGMEVGADWCDSWLVDKNWIASYRDDIKNREDKLDYFAESVQYLLDEVYDSPSGATIDGHPVIFLFGGGPNSGEMKRIMEKAYDYPAGLKEPYYIRRTGLTGSSSNGNVSFSNPVSTTQAWLDIGVDVHSWIVPRVRPMDENYPYFDSYASFDDVKQYARTYKQLWDQGKKVHVNTAVVAPGFDNRACAAWGQGKFHGFDRLDGEVYRWQWEFFNQNKNQIDVMFIASWSDFTEGHEIEPTIKNGCREVETTQEYAAEFRDKAANEGDKEALQIPQKIFEARQYAQKLEKAGFDTKDMTGILDAAALGASRGAYLFANAMLDQAVTLQKACEEDLEVETVTVSVPAGNLEILSFEADPAAGKDESKGVEVAHGKPVSANDDLSEGRAANAVDGVIADESRWITSQNKSSYWLEINLQNEFTLTGADLYTGKMDGTFGLRDVRLQALQGEDWVDIPGAGVSGNEESNTDLFWTFNEPVTTSKVRVVCDDGSIGVRLREIYVYADPAVTDLSLLHPEETVKGKNIAKGKKVTTNDALSTGPVSNLNDGEVSDNSRWISSQDSGTYWAEIDLGGEYELAAADLYMGKDDGSWALASARLEYSKDGEWVTIPGTELKGNDSTNTDVSFTFSPAITASKVRLVSDDGSRGVRVRELMLYTAGSPSGGADDDSFLELRGRELAQGKPVTASSELSGGPAARAVDGIETDGSMWMTKTSQDSYWLEIDLKDTCKVMGADVLSGRKDNTWAVENVQVQYQKDGRWESVPGGTITNNPKSRTELRWNFARPVETDRIRFNFADGTRGVKLREVRLYEGRASVENSETEVHNMSKGVWLTVDEATAKLLREHYFDGMLYMQYLGDNEQSFKVTADCSRPLPEKIGVTQGDYSVVSEVRQEITHGWEQCRFALYKDNLALEHNLENGADFLVKGTGNIRNIEMQFKVYKKKR